MIKKSSTYLTPECMVIYIQMEGVMCASQEPDNDGFTIVDFNKLSGSWS